MSFGISGWGCYIPRYRITTREIARVWGDDPLRIRDLYLIEEKTVENYDEDAVTMAVEASRRAIVRAGMSPKDIDAILVGTESKPYAVKPIASILIDALGARYNVQAVDSEFACKAASDMMILAYLSVREGKYSNVLVVATDASQGEPGEHLDYSASAGAAAFIISRNDVCAVIEDFYSYCSDTPDFWRRDGCLFPVHGEGFTGEPAYFRHIISAARGLMEKMGLKPSDFDYVIIHQPNARFPVRAASILGFPIEKVKPGLVVDRIGNTYNASALLGLVNVLDIAKPGSRILLVTYGSGAGSNAFSIYVTDKIEERRGRVETLQEMLKMKIYVDYSLYSRFRKLIKMLQ